VSVLAVVDRHEASRRAALAYVDALNRADPDAVAACVTADFVNEHASSRGAGVVGRDAYRGRLPAFLAEFERLRYQPEDVIVDGDLVAIPYRMSATWLGAPPARHTIALRGVFRLRIRDGLVAERTDYWDSADFLRQTGNRQQ
jgi:ketosteroid isomerase-like protein